MFTITSLRVNGKELTVERLQELAKKYGVPDYMMDGLFLYLAHGIPPGGFLTAVLSNDFMGSIERADNNNKLALVGWARLLYNELPSFSWGTPEKVQEWIDAKTQERLNNHPLDTPPTEG